MARNNRTPVDYWEGLTLGRLHKWMAANNRIFEREQAEREARRKK